MKSDRTGPSYFRKKLGEGPFLELKIPEHDKKYKLRLLVSKGENVTEVISSLNTPLY